jgi:predicted helicase
MIDFYNGQVKEFKISKSQNKDIKAIDFVQNNTKHIKWTEDLLKDIDSGVEHRFDEKSLTKVMRKPFCKQWLYYNKDFNWTHHLMPKFFPEKGNENLIIYITGVGASEKFSALVSNSIVDFKMQNNGQGFPLFVYEAGPSNYIQKSAVPDETLNKVKSIYKDNSINHEDVFFYIYGIMHSSIYRHEYQNDLKKMLPRIPYVKDFWGFSKAGRELVKWHLEYEKVEPYPLIEILKEGTFLNEKELLRVDGSGMKWHGNNKKFDKTKIAFNRYVTLSEVPIEAYDYEVNGKSAIEWIMERYCVSTDKDSGIENDPNEYSEDPRYIIDLVKRIVTVSVETMKIVNSLPALNEIV